VKQVLYYCAFPHYNGEAMIYDQIQKKKRVRDFVERQLRSARPAVRKKVELFLKKHNR